MSSFNRLDRAYEKAKIIPFDNDSKFIIFSDCHRGDNSFADDFANNRNIYFHALSHYFREGFQYCELGDGDELWENISFASIFEAHKNVFQLLRQFHLEKRLNMVWGNHDMVYRNPNYVEKHLTHYFEPIDGSDKSLFEGIQYHEALVLKHKETGQEGVLHPWAPSRLVELCLLENRQVFGPYFMETPSSCRYCRPHQSS